MISKKYKCIFVHIPKSGGTSVEDLIWPSSKDRTENNLWGGFINEFSNKYQTGGLQHLFATQIRNEIGEQTFNDYFKFTFVRNPWDRAVSQFSYMATRDDLRNLIGMNKSTDFKTYLSLIQKVKHVQWEPQYKFFLDENGCQIVDFVGRLENINRDMLYIADNLDIRKGIFRAKVKEIPHSKKSQRSHYQDYYDNESQEIVSNIYATDIRILGYKFDV